MIDLNEYILLGFNPQQLHQIEDGFNQGVDITRYIDPTFDWMQMEQIKLGLIEGMDVSIYADAKIPASRMEHIREKREIESGRTEIQEQAVKQYRLKSWEWRLRIIAITVFLGIAGYYGLQYCSMIGQDLNIEFTQNEVTIEYGHFFVPTKYIKEYTRGENVELVLPETMKMDTLGTQTVIYQIKNTYLTETFELAVHTVDSNPPVLTLNTHEVTLTKDEDSFTSAAYIISAIDEADGDLTDQIQVEMTETQEDQTVIYKVQDSSGNISTDELILHWKNPPEPEVVYVDRPVYVGGGESVRGSDTGGTYSEPSGNNAGSGHGTKYYMFSDGYNLDSGYTACASDLSQIGYGTCSPITGTDGLYTGYQLSY